MGGDGIADDEKMGRKSVVSICNDITDGSRLYVCTYIDKHQALDERTNARFQLLVPIHEASLHQLSCHRASHGIRISRSPKLKQAASGRYHRGGKQTQDKMFVRSSLAGLTPCDLQKQSPGPACLPLPEESCYQAHPNMGVREAWDDWFQEAAPSPNPRLSMGKSAH
ncbi:hypothetical protein L249_7223 [Ophiocordyceps polyrhachis-furcata BCC 54312]|uniref:Uncharacterized protein n=1 Tax=Ophiocordyceps polyrhachis-furcata BCC 54312 TaxID=1330021 RepID=A0A367LA35_9HYPO|nr:hypothetical protein L249_7223 [Ophiocordyceps polyrhachis-furcata BCC 54312]